MDGVHFIRMRLDYKLFPDSKGVGAPCLSRDEKRRKQAIKLYMRRRRRRKGGGEERRGEEGVGATRSRRRRIDYKVTFFNSWQR